MIGDKSDKEGLPSLISCEIICRQGSSRDRPILFIMPMHFTQVYNQERIYWFFSLNFLPPLIAISMKKSILIALSKPVVQRKPLDKEYLQGA